MTEPSQRRIALVGAAGMLGREIKEQLALAGIPGADVALLDLDEHVGLLTDYGDEARVIVEAAAETLRGFDVVIFSGNRGVTRQFAPTVIDDGGTVVDCTGDLPADGIWRGAASATLAAPATVLTVPHAGTLLLATLAAVLDMHGAVATVLLPASEGLERGPERLARQSVSLLSLGADDEDEDEAAGPAVRRAAFDQWPEAAATIRIADELARIDVVAPRLLAVRSPVFHGISASVWLPDTDADTARAALRGAAIAIAGVDDPEAVDSPARVAGVPGLHVAAVRDDAAGGCWVWAVIDNHLAAAGAVVEIVSLYRTVEGETRN